jgi:hypothetical protein
MPAEVIFGSQSSRFLNALADELTPHGFAGVSGCAATQGIATQRSTRHDVRDTGISCLLIFRK